MLKKNEHPFLVKFSSEEEKKKWLRLMKKMKHSTSMTFQLGLQSLIEKNHDYKQIDGMGMVLNAILQLKTMYREAGPRNEPHIVDTVVGRKILYVRIKIFEILINIDNTYTIVYTDDETKPGYYKTMKKKKKYVKKTVLESFFGKGEY